MDSRYQTCKCVPSAHVCKTMNHNTYVGQAGWEQALVVKLYKKKDDCICEIQQVRVAACMRQRNTSSQG